MNDDDGNGSVDSGKGAFVDGDDDDVSSYGDGR